MEESMDTPDSEDVANLADAALIERFQYTDWKNPQFISDERLVQLFSAARLAGNNARVGHCSNELSRRMLRRARAFAIKNSLVPQHFSDLEEAAEQLAGYMWEQLLNSKNADYAARRFGVFFKFKSLSFLRSLLAHRRPITESLEEGRQLDHEEADRDEDPGGDARDAAWRDGETPERRLEDAQEFRDVHAKLSTLLTSKEYSVFVMLWLRQMKIKDIAAALGVTPRTINTYRRSIEAKINQEIKV